MELQEPVRPVLPPQPEQHQRQRQPDRLTLRIQVIRTHLPHQAVPIRQAAHRQVLHQVPLIHQAVPPVQVALAAVVHQ